MPNKADRKIGRKEKAIDYLIDTPFHTGRMNAKATAAAAVAEGGNSETQRQREGAGKLRQAIHY
jgi:hypothetical protein